MTIRESDYANSTNPSDVDLGAARAAYKRAGDAVSSAEAHLQAGTSSNRVTALLDELDGLKDARDGAGNRLERLMQARAAHDRMLVDDAKATARREFAEALDHCTTPTTPLDERKSYMGRAWTLANHWGFGDRRLLPLREVR